MILRDLVDMLNNNVRKLPIKDLLSHCELLLYFTMTYRVLNPDRKGVHIAVD